VRCARRDLSLTVVPARWTDVAQRAARASPARPLATKALRLLRSASVERQRRGCMLLRGMQPSGCYVQEAPVVCL